MTAGLFVTGTGTGVGKTFATRALARALVRDGGRRVAALKPLETGCDPEPLDALALARACGRPELAHHRGLYRVAPPLAPYAATLEGHPAPPDPEQLAVTCRHLAREADVILVEGAGGILVPLDGTRDLADFARCLGLPIVLVARDALGVLSHVLTAVDSLRLRALDLAGVVLMPPPSGPADPSRATNARILADRLAPAWIVPFPPCADDDDALADTATTSGLLARALETLSHPP